MPKSRHICSLPARDTSGLPKLPPNASWASRCCRNLRKLFLMNPNHFKCSKLFRNKSSVLAERKRQANSPYSLVIHPLSILNAIMETLFICTWFFSLIVDPMMVYVDELPWYLDYTQRYIVPPVRIFLILIRFNIGYIDEKTKRVVIESRRIVFRYLRSYFIFDALTSSYPLLLLIYLSGKGLIKCSPDYIEESYCYEIIHLLRIVCCWTRINTLLTFVDDALANMRAGHTLRMLITKGTRTFIFLHLSAYVLYQVPFAIYRNNAPKTSWVVQKNVDQNQEMAHQYFQSLLIAICYFFGISNSVNIQLVEEQICVILISLFGRIYTLYLLADVLNVFGIVGVSESMYEKQLSLLQQYMAAKHLPANLRQRMLRFYEFKFQKRYFSEEEIVDSFSHHLRIELFLFTARQLIQKVEMFKRLPNAVVGALIGVMRVETYSPKDVIIRLGSDAADIFFISTGTVALLSKKGTELCHLEDGEEFGTPCLVFDQQIFSAVAVETTEVFIISREKLVEFLRPYPEVMGLFINTVKYKVENLKGIEGELTAGVDLFTDLRSGNILERRTMRLKATK